MKTILITGGTNGIGLYALKALKKDSFYPIFICRSKEKAQQVIAELGRGTYYCCDFENAVSVQQIAHEILQKETQIDYFVANAGVIGYDKESYTTEGIEKTIQVNFLAHYLLCETLLPLFRTSKTTLLFTSSLMHRSRIYANYDFSTSLNPPVFSPFKAYSRSKACMTVYPLYLAEKENEVTVVLTDPGIVKTGIMRSRGKWMNLLFRLGSIVFASPEKGASTLAYCLSQEPNQLQHGGYFKNKQLRTVDARAKNKNVQSDLYQRAKEASQKLLE